MKLIESFPAEPKILDMVGQLTVTTDILALASSAMVSQEIQERKIVSPICQYYLEIL